MALEKVVTDKFLLPSWTYFLPLPFFGLFLIEYHFGFDQTWFLWINHHAQVLPDQFWTSLSLFGNGWSAFGIALPLLLFARKALYAAVISGAFTGVLSHFAKKVAQTDRPAGVLDQNLFHIIDHPLLHSAMPSGHTMTVFAIATAIFFSLSASHKKAWLVIFVIACGTGISRIATGAHWPQDVLVGAGLGMYSGLLAAYYASFIPEHLLQWTAWPVKCIFLGSLISWYFLLVDTLDFEQNRPIQLIIAAWMLLTWIRALFLIQKLNKPNHV